MPTTNTQTQTTETTYDLRVLLPPQTTPTPTDHRETATESETAENLTTPIKHTHNA